MPPYRRSLAGACAAITSLFYIYWLLHPAFDKQIRFYHHLDGDVLNSTLGFAKIFVINLPSRPDRRDAMSRAAAASNLSLTWRAGLAGDQVADLPGLRTPGARGSWRAHMDAVAEIAQQQGSVLIMEDDVDWDVRLRRQLVEFAGASRTWLVRNAGTKHHDTIPTDDDGSIYGTGWDVLWLGHCGTDLPGKKEEDGVVVALPDDPTVPEPRHLKPHPFALRDGLGTAFAPHTRAVHAARGGTACSLAYAVSGRGARRIARAFHHHNYNYNQNQNQNRKENQNQNRNHNGNKEDEKRYYQWDLMLRDWCQGDGEENGEEYGEEGEEPPVCITVQPPLVSHYYSAGDGGGGSDIRGLGGGYAHSAGSPYIRLSVRGNLERLAAGVPEGELVDQWPDG
ncbi:glycosyltransferase family 25 protein [Biscogniauxia sp. FL1348]|nr:glycosyltransferase family 25 protein [Biscogniauxia sp. FL1348]